MSARRGVLHGVAPVPIAIVVAALSLSGCTGGSGSDGADAPESGGLAAAVTNPGEAAGDATGPARQAGGSTAGTPDPAAVVPDLPPPVAGAAAIGNSPELAAALAAMPGMYGLALLDVTLLDDRIEIVADVGCPTTLEVLQSGQWAVEVVTPPKTGAGSESVGDRGEGSSSARSDPESSGGMVYLAELRLGTQRSEVRLVESETSCQGSISLPA